MPRAGDRVRGVLADRPRLSDRAVRQARGRRRPAHLGGRAGGGRRGPALSGAPDEGRLPLSAPVTVEKYAVGQSARRVEDPRLLQGLGRYSDDVTLPRQAYAVIVRSPHAHARIRALDASAAAKADGVIAEIGRAHV